MTCLCSGNIKNHLFLFSPPHCVFYKLLVLHIESCFGIIIILVYKLQGIEPRVEMPAMYNIIVDVFTQLVVLVNTARGTHEGIIIFVIRVC